MIKIQNNTDTFKIELLGTIGEDFWSEGWTLDRFKNELAAVETPNVDIEIQSLGGDVMEAFAIYDAIRSMSQKVTTRIIGSTASAGTVIAMAGDDRVISPNSRFLVHNAWTMTVGDAEEHEKTSDQLESIDNQLAGIYQKVTGKHKKTMRGLMKENRWITAEEAKQWGFVNKIAKEKVLNLKQETMTEDLMKLMKVKNETDLLKAVNDLVEANEKLEANIGELQNKVKEYEVAEKQAQAESINNYLDEAVKAGKIKADAKDTFFALAETNFELVKNTIDGIVIPEKKSIQDVIDETEDKVDLPKFKDNLRKNIYKNNVEQYRRDFKQAYGYEPTI
jgi:ATP-dependent protease ClpP protease subunit